MRFWLVGVDAFGQIALIMKGFGLTLTNKAHSAFLRIDYNLLLALLLLNDHFKRDYIYCHVGASQGNLSLVKIISTKVQ